MVHGLVQSLDLDAIYGITVTILLILLLECFLRLAYLDIIGFFKDPLVVFLSFISFFHYDQKSYLLR
jgi:fumarate reductase subunit C